MYVEIPEASDSKGRRVHGCMEVGMQVPPVGVLWVCVHVLHAYVCLCMCTWVYRFPVPSLVKVSLSKLLRVLTFQPYQPQDKKRRKVTKSKQKFPFNPIKCVF